MFLLTLSCVCIAFVGCVLAFHSMLALRDFLRQSDAVVAHDPANVTILKPLFGAEPGLYDNLLSFVQQEYPGAVQIVFGVASESDPALPIVRRLIADHPTRDLALVIGQGRSRGNGKVGNLIGMVASIRHDCIVLSDSDIRVDRDYLTQITATLALPDVGLVTALYRGESNTGPWAVLSSMAIDFHFFPSVLLGLRLKKAHPCMGATMAFSRQTLDAIGGFHAFAGCLADDYAIGQAVRALGLRVVVGRQVVVHQCTERTMTDLVEHELRWARTLRTIDPRGFAGSFLTNPLPFALLAAMASNLVPGLGWLGVATLGVTVLCRCALQWRIERTLGIGTARWLLMPARDLLSFVLFCASFLTTDVVWRGHRYRVADDGSLTDLKGSPP